MNAPPASPFPAQLGGTASAARVPQRFGFVPSAVAISALFVSAANAIALVVRGDVDVQALGIVAGAFVVAVIAGGAEIYRRTRPTVLVFGPRIGIYRDGRFAADISRGQLTPYRLRLSNTIREVMGSGTFMLMGGAGVIVLLATAGLDAIQLPNVAWAFASFACGGAWLASAIWVRVMCVFYWIPNGNRVQQVVLRRSDLVRVGFPFA